MYIYGEPHFISNITLGHTTSSSNPFLHIDKFAPNYYHIFHENAANKVRPNQNIIIEFSRHFLYTHPGRRECRRTNPMFAIDLCSGSRRNPAINILHSVRGGSLTTFNTRHFAFTSWRETQRHELSAETTYELRVCR